LKQLGLDQNTLIIFGSDNGPVLDDGYEDGASTGQNGHVPSGIYSGGKYSVWEGGTRVPMIVNWPGHVPSGATSNALVCHVDLVNTLASLFNVELPATAAPDSFNEVNAIIYGTDNVGRGTLVESEGDSDIALRDGDWKLYPGSKGWELFNLAVDPGETNNVASSNATLLSQLTATLSSLESTPETRPVVSVNDPSPAVPAAPHWVYPALGIVLIGLMALIPRLRRVTKPRQS
jgi:arylsulfatase A-like enzyme